MRRAGLDLCNGASGLSSANDRLSKKTSQRAKFQISVIKLLSGIGYAFSSFLPLPFRFALTPNTRRTRRLVDALACQSHVVSRGFGLIGFSQHCRGGGSRPT